MGMKKRLLFEVVVEVDSDYFEDEVWDENTEDYITEYNEDGFIQQAYQNMERLLETGFWSEFFYLEDGTINLISQRAT